MELRKDYILDRYVLVSESRGKRPHEFQKEKAVEGVCYFCPGNEKLTPPEIFRIPSGNGWKIRVFPNKFAAVEEKGDSAVRTDNTFFTFSSGYGVHEVVVETPDHKKQLADLGVDEIKEILGIYSKRINEISLKPNIKYVSVFKNSGGEAGTSIVHSHTQIIATNIIPTLLKQELDAIKKFNHCPYCDIINIEKGSYRKCYENNSFVAFTPYASRFHYELWVFPKRHIKGINQMSETELIELAEILKKALLKLKSINAPYNFFLHYSQDDAYHFHIEICPRLAIWAGFEFSTDIVINSVSPEEAAEFYRG